MKIQEKFKTFFAYAKSCSRETSKLQHRAPLNSEEYILKKIAKFDQIIPPQALPSSSGQAQSGRFNDWGFSIIRKSRITAMNPPDVGAPSRGRDGYVE